MTAIVYDLSAPWTVKRPAIERAIRTRGLRRFGMPKLYESCLSCSILLIHTSFRLDPPLSLTRRFNEVALLPSPPSNRFSGFSLPRSLPPLRTPHSAFCTYLAPSRLPDHPV